MALVMRPYTGVADLASMQSLMHAAPNPFEAYPTAADLPELLDPAASDTPDNTILWEDVAGQLLGFAIVSAHNNLHFHFRASSLTEDVERQMMHWAITRVRLRAVAQRASESLTLDASARDDDAWKVAFLRRHGFVRTGEQTLYMARSLHEPFSEPQLLPGFAIRPLAGLGEVPAYVDAHRAAYGTAYMTVERRLAMMQGLGYHPELDLVAIAADGTLAAFCVCSIDAAENERTGHKEGEIAIVGRRPEFRRQGLGRAMVLAGMAGLKEHGMDAANLGVCGSNTAALRLHQSVGFETRFAKQWYSKAQR
jgi:mycothiol synthase